LIYRDFKSGVLTVEICDLAKYAYEKPLDILGFPFKIRLNPFERFGRLLFDTTHGIKEKFTPKSNLDRFFPCGRTAFIGIGGGSDIIQAAQLGLLLKEKPACFISIRSQKIGSQGAAGKINDVRFVHHHGGEIFPGVFRIMPDTTGTGRFLEHLVAGAGVPVYLVLKQSTELLQKQIQSAVAHAGGADNIVAVDTGGDCLYVKSPQKHIDAKTTPDQDFASLKAINALAGYKNKLTAVMALGVDSPPYAGRLMKNVGAQLFSFSPAQTKSLLNNYTRFKIDGKNNSFYGKTVLAFQQALRGEKNFIIVPLPVSVVVSKTAPWDPFVHLNAYSDKLIVMDLKKHFAAIDGGFKDTDNAR
jgi:hypothetical protein